MWIIQIHWPKISFSEAWEEFLFLGIYAKTYVNIEKKKKESEAWKLVCICRVV